MRPKNTGILLTICLLITLGVISSVITPSLRANSTLESTGTISFTLIVNQNGFNGTATTLDLTVNQGDWVQITFIYGDNNLTTDNPHVIAIEGYGLQTATISKSNPNATLRFVADVTGTFKIYCNLPCRGMASLQAAALVVLPARGIRTPTELNLTAINETSDVLITAKVNEANGTPLAGVPVTFYENTIFGELWLHTMLTGSNGEIDHHYTLGRSSSVEIIANYPGNATYANSTSKVSFTAPGNGSLLAGPRYYGITFPFNLAMIAVPTSVNIAITLVVGLVLFGVWFNYAYVLRQILSLPKHEDATDEKESKPLPRRETGEQMGSTHKPILIQPETDLPKNGLAVLLISPLLGAANMLLAGSIHLSLLYEGTLLLGLSLLETLVITLVIQHRSKSMKTESNPGW